MKEKTKKIKKKSDKRFLILNIAIIAVIVFAFGYVWTVGDDYTLHTNFYPEDGTTKNVVVDVKDDDVVEFVNVRTEKGELVADFRSDNRGKTDVLISYTIGDTKMEPMVFNLEVNEFDTIIDHTMGSVRFNGDKAVIISIIVLLVLAEIMMLWMYIDYRKHGKFSYSMIACGGLSIFNAILLAYVIYYLINWPTLSIGDFLMLVTGAGTIMLVILFPLMLLLSILLAISNIWLMKHEGYRPVNALGIFFAVIWALGTLGTLGIYFIPFDSLGIIGPGLRIAYAAFGGEYRKQILHGLANINIKTSSFDAEVITELILSGAAYKIAEQKRRMTRKTGKIFTDLFGDILPDSGREGYFRWVPIATREPAAVVEKDLLRRGIRVYHSQRFSAAQEEDRHYLRVALCSAGSPTKLESGLHTLRTWMEETGEIPLEASTKSCS